MDETLQRAETNPYVTPYNNRHTDQIYQIHSINFMLYKTKVIATEFTQSTSTKYDISR